MGHVLEVGIGEEACWTWSDNPALWCCWSMLMPSSISIVPGTGEGKCLLLGLLLCFSLFLWLGVAATAARLAPRLAFTRFFPSSWFASSLVLGVLGVLGVHSSCLITTSSIWWFWLVELVLCHLSLRLLDSLFDGFGCCSLVGDVLNDWRAFSLSLTWLMSSSDQ